MCTSFKVVYLKDKMLSSWVKDMKIKSIADKTKKPVFTSYVLFDIDTEGVSLQQP